MKNTDRLGDYNLDPPDTYSDFTQLTDDELVCEIAHMRNVTDYDGESYIPRYRRLENESYLKDLLQEAVYRGLF